MNPSFENSEFGYNNLTSNIDVKHFLTEFDRNRIMVQIFYDLKDQFITKINLKF